VSIVHEGVEPQRLADCCHRQCLRVGSDRKELTDGEVTRVAISFQLVIDCADPGLPARFWAAALRYEPERPPVGFASWDEYRRDVGVPEEELGLGTDRISDPDGAGPRIWFQVVPEGKATVSRTLTQPHSAAAAS